MNILLQTCFDGHIFNYHLYYARINFLPALLLFGNKERQVRIIAKREILVDILMSNRINKTHAWLIPLSDNRKAINPRFNLCALEATKLAIAKSRTEK